jgi:hypothetical protein
MRINIDTIEDYGDGNILHSLGLYVSGVYLPKNIDILLFFGK